MAKHVKVGDKLEVVFAPAHRGVQTLELINGKRAFAVDSGPAPLSGDRWEVQVVGQNRTRTVYFVEPLNLVDAADGMGEVLKQYPPFYHEFIRKTEVELIDLLSVTTPGAHTYREDLLLAEAEAEGQERIIVLFDSPEGETETDVEDDQSYTPADELADILASGVLPETYRTACLERFAAH